MSVFKYQPMTGTHMTIHSTHSCAKLQRHLTDILQCQHALHVLLHLLKSAFHLFLQKSAALHQGRGS